MNRINPKPPSRKLVTLNRNKAGLRKMPRYIPPPSNTTRFQQRFMS